MLFIPLSTIKNVSASINNFIFFFVFFKVAAQANLGAERNVDGFNL